MDHICYYTKIPVVVFFSHTITCRAGIFCCDIFSGVNRKVVMFGIKTIPFTIPSPVAVEVSVPITIKDPSMSSTMVIV